MVIGVTVGRLLLLLLLFVPPHSRVSARYYAVFTRKTEMVAVKVIIYTVHLACERSCAAHRYRMRWHPVPRAHTVANFMFSFMFSSIIFFTLFFVGHSTRMERMRFVVGLDSQDKWIDVALHTSQLLPSDVSRSYCTFIISPVRTNDNGINGMNGNNNNNYYYGEKCGMSKSVMFDRQAAVTMAVDTIKQKWNWQRDANLGVLHFSDFFFHVNWSQTK